MKADIKYLIEIKLEGDESFGDAWELYQHLDYDGSLHELIDSSIDIYYCDLREWAVDNWEFVEEALNEGLCRCVSDYHKLIQMGQYVALKGEAYDIVKSIYDDFNDEVTS